MDIKNDYNFYYFDKNTIVLPSVQSLLQLLISLSQSFLLPLFVYFYIINIMAVKDNREQIITLCAKPVRIPNFIVRFSLLSFIIHVCIYIVFLLNYHGNRYKIMCVNFIAFGIILYINVYGNLKIEQQQLILIISGFVIIFLSRDSLLFQVTGDGKFISNRMEDIEMLIEENFYLVYFKVKNGKLMILKYKILKQNKLSQGDMEFLQVIKVIKSNMPTD